MSAGIFSSGPGSITVDLVACAPVEVFQIDRGGEWADDHDAAEEMIRETWFYGWLLPLMRPAVRGPNPQTMTDTELERAFQGAEAAATAAAQHLEELRREMNRRRW